MDYSVGRPGRMVVARLRHGEALYASVEELAAREKIAHAVVWVIGGIGRAGVVVGPEDARALPPKPMVERFDDAREIVGTGVLAPDARGRPKLHLHAAIGRGKTPLVGCPREGAECWLVQEVVIQEIDGVDAVRAHDPQSGFELLQVDPKRRQPRIARKGAGERGKTRKARARLNASTLSATKPITPSATNPRSQRLGFDVIHPPLARVSA